MLLNYSAAFDTIDHHIMLQRLHHRFGINDSALEWFTSYFANRQQSVLINQISSPSHNVNTGVPQGSVLGPLCFTMYTSPLEDLIASYGVSCMIYADDIQLYVTMTEQQRPDVIQQLESCLTHIQSWSTANKLKLNSDKTEVIHITSQFKQHTPIESLRISDCCTRPVTCARDLGTIITSNLRMQNQVNNICRSSYLALHKIGQIRNFLDKQTTEKLVHAFISCRLDFCNSLLHCIPDSQTSKLQRIQNSAARLVTRSSSRQHITPILRSLHWLPVNERIVFKILLLTHKCIHGSAPAYLRELIQLYKPQRTLRSSSTLLLSTPVTRTKTYGHRSFMHASPSLWNSLPHHIRTVTSENEFKSLLKTHLFH